MSENTTLLIFAANATKPNNYIENYVFEIKNFLFESIMDYPFNNILENSMNISFVNFKLDSNKSNYDYEIICLINGNFSEENNITIKNNLNYETFFGDFRKLSS